MCIPILKHVHVYTYRETFTYLLRHVYPIHMYTPQTIYMVFIPFPNIYYSSTLLSPSHLPLPLLFQLIRIPYLPFAEFDRFLADRAAVGESLPAADSDQSTGTGRGRQMRKDDSENALFAL